MELPPPDPQKILDYWTEWEDGDVSPGRLISNLKTAGLPDLLQQLVADASPSRPGDPAGGSPTSGGPAGPGPASEARPVG